MDARQATDIDIYKNPDRALRAIVAEKNNSDLEIKYLDIAAAVRISSDTPGPKVVIFGSSHGDERCGTDAVKRMLTNFAAGNATLSCGELTLAIGNERALAEDKRYISDNLNRYFRDDTKANPDTYEKQRAIELMGLLDDCNYFLDIHSTFRPTSPYLIAECHLLRKALEFGAPDIVLGWGDLAAASLAGDAETYSHRCGAVGFTLECGQHTAESSFELAFESAKHFLDFSGITGGPNMSAAKYDREQLIHHLQMAYEMPEVGFRYHDKVAARNLEPLAKGQIIGYAGTEAVVAPYKATLVLPKEPARLKPGEEVFMLAKYVPASTLL